MKKATPLTNVPEERIVLGKILQSETNFWAIAEQLKPEHFSVKIHQQIYSAVKSILIEGKKCSLQMVQSRIGEEYDDDGKSTMTLMTALIRDAEEGDLEGVDIIIDLYRHRKFIETLESSLKEAKKDTANSVDVMAQHQQLLEDISHNSQTEPLNSVGTIASKVLNMSSKAHSSGLVPGFDTGLPSLDEILGRIHPGDLGFIGARPGDGKSVLGAQLAMRAQLYMPAIYFQLEMTGEDMTARMLASETNISVSDIESGSFDIMAMEDLKAAGERLKNVNVFIDDRVQLYVDQIWERCQHLKRSRGLGLAVIDHVRLVRAHGRFQNMFDLTEHVTGKLKAMAKDLGIAVIALSQVTRASQRREDPAPLLNDFAGGSSIEQDADWVLAMFRRDRWLRQNRPREMDSQEGRNWTEQWAACKGKIEIYTRKVRRGEDGERRDFTFDGRRGLLAEVDG